MTTYRSFIGGKWIDSTSGRTAPNVNPANIDGVTGTIELASRDEARRAVECGRRPAGVEAIPRFLSYGGPPIRLTAELRS